MGKPKQEFVEGEKVGEMYFVREAEPALYSGRKIRMAVFRCECGNETIGVVSSVKNGHWNSCGKCDKAWPTKLPGDEAAFRILYRTYSSMAKERGLRFCISREDFRNLTSQHCEYCGCPPAQQIYSESRRSVYVYNGLDRVDSGGHYENNNVVPSCGDCNIAKMTFTQTEFMDWVVRFLLHQLSRQPLRYGLDEVVRKLAGRVISAIPPKAKGTIK